MSFEIQMQDVSSGSTTFSFSDTVSQYVIGIAYFDLAYPNGDDHDLQDMKIQLTSSLITDSGGTANQVSVSAALLFQDNDGNTYSSSDSRLTLTCLAVVGSSDLNAQLTNLTNIAANSAQKTSTPQNPVINLGLISGVNYSYSRNHKVMSCAAAVGSSSDSSGETNVSASGDLSDESGNSATVSLDAGLVAVSGTSNNLLMQKHSYTSDSSSWVGDVNSMNYTDDFGQPVTGAGVFLQSWSAAYDDGDHQLSAMVAGATGISIFDSGQVASTYAIRIPDEQGHWKNGNCTFSLDAIVVATSA